MCVSSTILILHVEMSRRRSRKHRKYLAASTQNSDVNHETHQKEAVRNGTQASGVESFEEMNAVDYIEFLNETARRTASLDPQYGQVVNEITRVCDATFFGQPNLFDSIVSNPGKVRHTFQLPASAVGKYCSSILHDLSDHLGHMLIGMCGLQSRMDLNPLQMAIVLNRVRQTLEFLNTVAKRAMDLLCEHERSLRLKEVVKRERHQDNIFSVGHEIHALFTGAQIDWNLLGLEEILSRMEVPR